MGLPAIAAWTSTHWGQRRAGNETLLKLMNTKSGLRARTWSAHGTIQRRQRKHANASFAPSLQRLSHVSKAMKSIWCSIGKAGDDSELKVPKPRNGEHRWTLDATTTDIISELARLMADITRSACNPDPEWHDIGSSRSAFA
jgi:hypothetical protein